MGDCWKKQKTLSRRSLQLREEMSNVSPTQDQADALWTWEEEEFSGLLSRLWVSRQQAAVSSSNLFCAVDLAKELSWL